jgi:AraC-like DNA-binding protein
MTPTKLFREIIPLTSNDCFTFFSGIKSALNFPVHYHEEYELNFIENAPGAKRIIGNTASEIEDMELVLVGCNLPHAWATHQCKNKKIHQITIQFHKDLFDEKLLQRNPLALIKNMFEKSARGILFSKETAMQVYPRLVGLNQKTGFESLLELISILHDLSVSKNMILLSHPTVNQPTPQGNYNSRRIEEALDYMNKHFEKPITLSEVSHVVNMSESSFGRFFKLRTGNTFVNSLNEIRLGKASRMLIETTHSIADIAFNCGFYNISNFNRIFKKKKNETPIQFRKEYNSQGVRSFY